MFIIVNGQYSDWELMGYVDSEKEAMDLCATHNATCDDYDKWYFIEVKHIMEVALLQEGFYEYKVVFNPDKEFLYSELWTMFPSVREKPRVVQEDQYCYVVIVTAKEEEEAQKIAKDFLMQTLAERVGIC